MTVLAFPGRTKRCNDRALALVRASIVADLTESKSLKNGESRALRALVEAANWFRAAAYIFMFFVFAAVVFGVCGAALALGVEGGKWIFHWVFG
jgi:hypothetical protein